MTRPRKGSSAHAAQQVVAIARGGRDALDAALALVAGADDRLSFRCSSARKRAYEQKAKRAGVPLTKWVLAVLDSAP